MYGVLAEDNILVLLIRMKLRGSACGRMVWYRVSENLG